MEKRNEISGSEPLRIAITGPESTGKTMLAKELAKHYDTKYVQEAARYYLEFLGREYWYIDLLAIAKKQLIGEYACTRKVTDYLICDTELTVIKIWSMHKYKKCHPWILDKIDKIKYDLYLLCDIDLPWEFDPLREHPDLRPFFLDWFKRELSARKIPYIMITGEKEKRFKTAIDVIETLNEVRKKKL